MDLINRRGFLKILGIGTIGGTLFGCHSNPRTGGKSISNKSGRKFFIDSTGGDDTNDGKTPEAAWKSLQRAKKAEFEAGDSLLLKRGSTFTGSLVFYRIIGNENNPFDVTSYGSGPLPKINSAGYLAGVSIIDCRYVNISDLDISSDAGTLMDQEAKKKRYGVQIKALSAGSYTNISLKNLKIHDIFANVSVPKKGKNSTSNMGMGVFTQSGGENKAILSNILIKGCTIRRTGHKGISIHGKSYPGTSSYSTNGVQIINNHLSEIGGPGMNINRTNNAIVKLNTVDGSGSSADSRMHGRGSGIWPWTSNNISIEHNKFMHARGKADSCGAHIDFNCKNVVIQYNLSYDNAGGFVEILGNTYNCSYRYNISVNDGFRIKGKDGAGQDGQTIWLSNFTGKHGKRRGPYNTYIYNNTVFVHKNQRAVFNIMDTAAGFLIANNIFAIRGKPAVEISKSVMERKENKINTNVYLSSGTSSLSNLDTSPVTIDSLGFKHPGSKEAADYTPSTEQIKKGKGIMVSKIPGDEIGLRIGLQVTEDYLGNEVTEIPDLGAIEYS